MKIISGLFDRMVLQRNARNQSDTPVRAVTITSGDVFVRVNRKSWKHVARARANKEFRFTLASLRVGGPYAIDIEVRDSRRRSVDALSVKDVLVGDVWIAAGQSNMEGIGLRRYAEKPHPVVRAFYSTDRWDIARDPIHRQWEAVDPIHHSFGPVTHNPDIGTGPAVAFVVDMHRQTRVPQGVIACAHGGTSMDQWDPAQRDRLGDSLYGAMYRRLQKNGGKVAGLIWYQGESDTVDERVASGYTDKMKRFVRAVRRDTRASALPVVAVQISRCASELFPFWNSVQDQQRRLPGVIRHLAVVPAVDLRLEDMIHIGDQDNNRLGRRMARAMLQLVEPMRQIKPQIALRRCRIKPDPIQPYANVVVEFDHVEGKLMTNGGPRPWGFSITSDPPGAELVYDVRLQGDRAIVHTRLTLDELRGRSIHYGRGTNPFCNIIDAADRSLPAFGPVPIRESSAIV